LETADGVVTLIDGMGHRDGCADLVRILRGERGRVAVRMELVIRCEYGSIIPWVRRLDDGRVTAVAGPDRLTLATPAAVHGENLRTVAEFDIRAGEEIPFSLTWSPSYRSVPVAADAHDTIEKSTAGWRRWARSHKAEGSGEWSEAVLRSLITLKALTQSGDRRDCCGGHHLAAGVARGSAQLGLPVLLVARCHLDALRLSELGLLRGGGGVVRLAFACRRRRAAAMQIMYGIAGERRLIEDEVPWLKGYEGAAPVRIGNAAADQLQLDVYGEVLDSLYQARRMGLPANKAAWALERALVEYLETVWEQPDEGIWEVRGGRRQFTHSKVMAWVAFDRAVRSVEEFGLDGPVERWLSRLPFLTGLSVPRLAGADAAAPDRHGAIQIR
jgi:GH15 family glucan-1,4-alpha-glucosidase